MKNYILLFSLIGLFISCADNNHVCDVPTNGFIDGSDQTIMMGSQETVEVFKKIDAAWAARDYETLKTLISNDGNFTHDDNTISTNAEEFIAHIEAGYQTSLESGEEGDVGFGSKQRASKLDFSIFKKTILPFIGRLFSLFIIKIHPNQLDISII